MGKHGLDNIYLNFRNFCLLYLAVTVDWPLAVKKA